MNEFNPDWRISPGEHLQEYLDYFLLTPEEFTKISDIPVITINKILSNEIVINKKLSEQIGNVFGQHHKFWINIQKLYDKPL